MRITGSEESLNSLVGNFDRYISENQHFKTKICPFIHYLVYLWNE